MAGNKKDLCEDMNDASERQVTSDEAQELARTYAMNYKETSAKTNEGVQELMENIFEKILEEKLKTMVQAVKKQPDPNPKFPLNRNRHSEVGKR